MATGKKPTLESLSADLESLTSAFTGFVTQTDERLRTLYTEMVRRDEVIQDVITALVNSLLDGQTVDDKAKLRTWLDTNSPG